MKVVHQGVCRLELSSLIHFGQLTCRVILIPFVLDLSFRASRGGCLLRLDRSSVYDLRPAKNFQSVGTRSSWRLLHHLIDIHLVTQFEDFSDLESDIK